MTWEWLVRDGMERFYEEEGDRGFYLATTGDAMMSEELKSEKSRESVV